MTQKTLHRKPSAQHGEARQARQARPARQARTDRTDRPARTARPGKKRRLSRGSLLLLLAMAYGSTIALLLVTVGFAAVVGDGGTSHGTHGAHQPQAANHDHGQSNNGPQPNIQIQARHIGNLVLDIKAVVTMNQGRDTLMKAKVVAYTDMVEMPGSHGKGPLTMQEADGNPGTYQTTAQMPMPGDYKIRVVVDDPVHGEQATTVSVSTVSQR